MITFGRMGFGAAPIGNLFREYTDEECHAALETAWNAGIRYFDTAPHYGLGLSERRLGAFLRTKPRDEFVLSTKVGRLIVPAGTPGSDPVDGEGFIADGALTRKFDPSESGIRRSVEDSLTRLGLDRVDILYLHDPDVYDLDHGLREGLPALAALRAEGTARAIGVGVNWSDIATRAVREGDLDLVMLAGRYTLLEQPAAVDLFPVAAERGVRIVNVAVYNSGLLATPEPRADAHYNYGTVPTAQLERARALAAVCREFGVELPAAALQFSLRNPLVATVVVGSANPRSVVENVERMQVEIPEALWDALVERGFIPA